MNRKLNLILTKDQKIHRSRIHRSYFITSEEEFSYFIRP